MVTSTSLFNKEKILLDPENPLYNTPESLYYGDVQTGTWFKDANRNTLTLPNHSMLPFYHFIDALSVNKHDTLTVEAVSTYCLWFNQKYRNRSSAWWVQDFVQDQKLFHDKKYISGIIRLKISHMFKEMKDIRDSGGMSLTLDFGMYCKNKVIYILVIQFIIGDCKDNNVLCGRECSNSLNMNGLCRDSDIHPLDRDNIFIGKETHVNILLRKI